MNAEESSIRQILLDTTEMLRQHVIVEGKVVDLGSQSTYLILEEESSKLLVLTTKISESVLTKIRNSRVRILGTVESGKQGLPLLKAESIKES